MSRTIEHRTIEKEVFVNATPDVVWKTLTEADELTRWFPVEARVTPGLGGEIWLSWSSGSQGAAPITAWEPNRRFQWTESRGPVKMAVDFHLTAQDGGTVVRLVQSGFGDGPEWDNEFHMTNGGWSYFMEHLKWYLTRHAGTPRDLISFRDASTLSSEDAFARLLNALAPFNPLVVADSRGTGQWGAILPSLNDAIVFVEMEPGKDGIRAGFWLSTYGLSTDALKGARDKFARLYNGAMRQ